jgi:hypothetical protein
MTDVNFIVIDSGTGEISRAGLCDASLVAAQAVHPGEIAHQVPNGVVAWPTPDPAPLRSFVWEKVKEKRDGVIDGGAPTAIGVVDSDELSRSNISGAALGALIAQSASTPFSIEWTAKDNSVHTLDAAGMIGLGLAVLQHVSAAHDRARDLRAEIEAATDVPTLLQIDIDTGWPS